MDDAENCSLENKKLEGDVSDLTKEQKLIGAGEKLLKANNLKGKLCKYQPLQNKFHR